MNHRAKARFIAELAEGNRRAARNIDCPRCGAPCIRGDDHDDVALTVTVDTEPVDPAGELLAHLNGSHTYELSRATGKQARPGTYVLYERNLFHLRGGRPVKGTVHVLHTCTSTHRKAPDEPVVPALW